MATLKQIDHFVVLMLENRSFDNLFGLLYPKSAGFDGLADNESNPDGQGGQVTVWQGQANDRAMRLPDPDPGELFTDITQQLFGTAPATGRPAMNGFATNYASHGGRPLDIMHTYSREQLPALSALARSYAVCDRWFASAPCQTWPNRFFLHTATAGGYENNSPKHFPYLMETIFNRLDGVAPQGWKVYFHDFPQSLSLTRLWGNLDRFQLFSEFLKDCANNSLPSYSFIEPRYFADLELPNDMHPPHDLVYGDRLVAQVYAALRASSGWDKTMLIVLFDEHGGCFDHVPPPAAVPPEPMKPGQVFAFDRFGVRVPAIVVSPWIRPGTIFRAPGTQPFDHTAIIKTLRKRFDLMAPLSARDAGAPDLESVLNLPAASDLGRLDVQSRPVSAADEAAALAAALQAPLNDLQKSLHEAAAWLELLYRTGAIGHPPELPANGGTPTVPAAGIVSEATGFLGRVLGGLGIK